MWVSGFHGSGKSHLVKMLRALWVDSAFDDGATARGMAYLPQGVSDQLKELSTPNRCHRHLQPQEARSQGTGRKGDADQPG